MFFKIIDDKDRAGVIDYLAKLVIKRPYEVSIKVYRKKRSIRQNSLYWLWLNAIADETGATADSLHRYFKDTYLPKRQVKIMGKKIQEPISTKELDTKQFSDYTNHIEVEAADIGIVLIHPEDQLWDQFYDHYKDRI